MNDRLRIIGAAAKAAQQRPAEQPGGALSVAEAMQVSEAPGHRKALEQVADLVYEAREMRAWFERKLREALPEGFDFSTVLDFADWKARELHLRDRLERMGRADG